MASLVAFISVLKRELFTATKKTPLMTLLTILVVFALEKMLTTTNIFKCPNEGYRWYGGMFLFIPPFCLSGLTLLMSNSFWDSATSRLRGEFAPKIVCSSVCYSLAKASLVGVAWLVVAFGTTEFYVCFRVGKSDADGRADEMKAQSTMLAWAMLACIIAVGLLYVAIRKCFFPHHERECNIQTLRDYERLETEAAISKFKEEIKQLAEKQGEQEVMDILDEAKNGSDVRDVVSKAKKMLLAKYSRMTQCMQNGGDPDESCLLPPSNKKEVKMQSTTTAV